VAGLLTVGATIRGNLIGTDKNAAKAIPNETGVGLFALKVGGPSRESIVAGNVIAGKP